MTGGGGMFPLRIVSGGQTGVDRAALDAALARGLPCGGWCPAGRWAEDGTIPEHYPLREAPSRDPARRTRLNVRDSEATLIVVAGVRGPGTELTEKAAKNLGRPVFVADLAAGDPAETAARARAWIVEGGISVLNVAGPRESVSPGIGTRARDFLETVLAG